MTQAETIKNVDIAVVGGGASGFAASISAAEINKGIKIAIVEKGQ